MAKLFEGASYKKQNVIIDFYGTVKMYLTKQIGSNATNASFSNEVLKPLEMNNIRDNQIQDLSGGELQRVANSFSRDLTSKNEFLLSLLGSKG